MKRTIIRNAKIWTADKEKPWADTLAAEGEKLIFVGKELEMPETYKEGAYIIDVNQRMVIPSFIDSHLHVSTVAASTYFFVLKKADSMEGMFCQIRDYAKEHPELPYIYATPCPTEWMDDKKVRREWLDEYVADRPVLLADANFHRCLVNSLMLELMEITPETAGEDTRLRTYEVDEDNQLTGIVYEHAYDDDIQKMYEKINWFPPNPEDGYVMLPFLEKLNSWGVSCVMDGITESEDTLKGMKKLDELGLLHHYYHATSLFQYKDELDGAIARLQEWQEKYQGKHIVIDTMKLFLDGTNEIGTSAVIEPFVNDPEGKNCGKLIMEEEELCEVFLRLQEENLNIQIHLVGDRAFRTALNAAEQARKQWQDRGKEWTIRINLLHCELTKPEDRKRPAQLGVHINWSPHWSGGIFGEDAKQYLGEERFQSMYAFNEMIQSNAVVGFSSDIVELQEVTRANPFVGMQIGHTRVDALAGGKLRLPAEECISREDLLYGYTYQNAVALGVEDKIGSLREGLMANFCILNRNFFEVPANEIEKVHPEMIMFEGKWI